MPRLRPALALVLALLTAATVAGCSNSTAAEPKATSSASTASLEQLAPYRDPKLITGGSTAVLADEAITPVTTTPEQSLPATVTSHDLGGDTSVTVTSTKRILGIDLAGSIAGTLVGLGFGGSLVGRDVSTTLPDLAKLPVVTTGGHSVNSESIIALRPTLVITDGTIGPIDVVLQLRDAGIPIVFVKSAKSAAGAADLARQVAAAAGARPAGELLAQRITEQTDAEVARIAAAAPSDPAHKLRMIFLYLRGSAGIYYLFGEGSGADQLIDSLGGIDVAKQIGWSGMKPMTDEALIAADPDLILVMTDGLESVGGVDKLIADKPAIGLTTAGRNKRFVDMADGDILSFGPRYPAVLDALAVAVYAPQKQRSDR